MRRRPWITNTLALALFAALPWAARRASVLAFDVLLRTSLDWLREPLVMLLETFSRSLGAAVGTTVFFAMLVGPVLAIARVVANARTRAGLADPLAGLRASAARQPRALDLLVAVPPVLTMLGLLVYARGATLSTQPAAIALAVLLTTVAQVRLGRAAARVLLAEPGRIETTAREGITYQAIARSKQTTGAVGLVAALSIAMVALVASVPAGALFRDPRLIGAILAYASVTALAAVFFRHASRAAIGVDGIRVYGTSRTRFVPYRELDAVTTRGVDIVLRRGDAVVLVLQLHGEDAGRRDEVVAHVAASIERASRERNEAKTQLVAAATAADLARLAEGATDYRSAALTREQLWEVAVSPTLDAQARAIALATLAGSPAERERVRVAVEQCAAPGVRIVLDQLERTEEDAETRGKAAAR